MNQKRHESRMLVTGAGGMVGSYVAKQLHDYAPILTDVLAGFENLDVCDPAAVSQMIAKARPEIVLHLAAATDVDRCEREPDVAFRANAIATQNVALACQQHDAVLIYVSTGGVFSGNKPEPFTEFDRPAPVNVYGRSKLAGEVIVQNLLRRYFIVRAGWMIGGGAKDKKFVGKLVELIRGGGQTPLRAVDDKFGSPTYGKDFVAGIGSLLERREYGLYHLANGGVCSRYDVAMELRALVKREDVQIESVSSAYFPLPAPRARSEALRNYKLELLGRNPMRPWRDAVRDYVTTELLV